MKSTFMKLVTITAAITGLSVLTTQAANVTFNVHKSDGTTALENVKIQSYSGGTLSGPNYTNSSGEYTGSYTGTYKFKFTYENSTINTDYINIVNDTTINIYILLM